MNPSPSEPLIVADGEGWIVLEKPPGRLVVPGREGAGAELCLRDQLSRSLERVILVVHRLDRGTSGLLLMATDVVAHRTLCLAFQERRVEKRYLALVRGTPDPPEGTIRTPLHTARRGKMRPARAGEPGSRQAETVYRTLSKVPGAALLELRPVTGRRHQLRVHLRSIGHPLLQDPLYGGTGSRDPGELRRLTLHASHLEFDDPATGWRIRLESPLPEDLRRLAACRRLVIPDDA